MKFCIECGSKCESVGGKPAKFCSECGYQLGGASKHDVSPQRIHANVEDDFDNISLAVNLIGEGENKPIKFNQLIGQGQVNMPRRRHGNANLKQIQEQLRSNQIIDV